MYTALGRWFCLLYLACVDKVVWSRVPGLEAFPYLQLSTPISLQMFSERFLYSLCYRQEVAAEIAWAGLCFAVLLSFELQGWWDKLSAPGTYPVRWKRKVPRLGDGVLSC